MPKYIVQIGNRELEVQAPTAQAAVDAAMMQYPGEIVQGYGLLSTEDETPEVPTEGTAGEPENAA